MEILLLLGIYCVELVCYQVVLKILFQVEVKNRVWIGLGCVLGIVIGILPINIAGKNFLVTVDVIIIVFVSIDGKLVFRSVRLLLAMLLLTCIDATFTYIFDGIVSFQKTDFIEYISYLVSKIIVLTFVSILNIIKEKIIEHKKTHISSAIYFVIGIIILLLLFCLSFLNQAILYLPNNRYIIFCNIVIVAIPINICMLVIFVIYINNTHERMEHLLKTERLLKESQVNYYKQILKKEASTQKYRHDMVNHLVYVQEVLSQNKLEVAQNYLSNMLGGFKKIQNIHYVTGNEMIDTIMNYFIGMLPKDTKIEIKGKSPVIINMEDTDVCTIFSNIFQNIVEEIVDHNIKEAKIMVEVQKGQQYVQYTIKNSLYIEIEEKNIYRHGLIKTHKLDRQNHGIGMINIENAVNRGGGKYKWYQETGYFCVEVILPVKNY